MPKTMAATKMSKIRKAARSASFSLRLSWFSGISTPPNDQRQHKTRRYRKSIDRQENLLICEVAVATSPNENNQSHSEAHNNRTLNDNDTPLSIFAEPTKIRHCVPRIQWQALRERVSKIWLDRPRSRKPA